MGNDRNKTKEATTKDRGTTKGQTNKTVGISDRGIASTRLCGSPDNITSHHKGLEFEMVPYHQSWP